jgi:hypothetical protein
VLVAFMMIVREFAFAQLEKADLDKGSRWAGASRLWRA